MYFEHFDKTNSLSKRVKSKNQVNPAEIGVLDTLLTFLVGFPKKKFREKDKKPDFDVSQNKKISPKKI